MEMEGYEATCVTNIRDALTAIQRMTFDLAILDMQLPDGTGFDVSDQLKGTATAVIFLTVVDDENSIVKAFDDGAFDYVVKPFRIRELLARIKRTLSSQNPKTGYTVRIARVDTMVKMLNVAIVLAEIVMYGFVILLILMGFTSVISTLSTNIRIRSREFAILKSVGMTSASLRKMIYWESILCILKASLSGISLGIALPFVINLSIRKSFPVLYHIPWGTFVIGMFLLISVVMLITYVEINKLKNKSIIDEIRMDVM